MSLLKSILSDFKLFLERVTGYIYWNSKGVRIQLSCRISIHAKIGPGCSFVDHSYIGPDVIIGSSCYGSRVFLNSCKIGSYCSLAPNVMVGLDEHKLDAQSTHPSFFDSVSFNKTLKKPEIGNHVWLGAGAIILKGVRIEDHAVVAAGAVVIKDIAKHQVVGGVPARFLFERDSNNEA